MSQPVLDLNLLQTLVAIHQTGTLARAADRVGRTQSAISLQVQRLQEQVDVELFGRQGRSLVLTEAGHALVGYAERLLSLNDEAVAAVRGRKVAGKVAFGMSVDFEHTWLPKAMARFAKTHPRIEVELRVDRNTPLEQAVARREIDIALLFGPARQDRTLLCTAPMAWIASPQFEWDRRADLGLLLLENPCIFSSAATRALDRARIGWRVAVTSPSVSGLWATALAGMGVTTRSAAALPEGLQDVGARFALPPLPEMGIRLVEADGRGTAPRATLRKVLRDVVEEHILR
jgi:DNA-binding transcriptional LysR family regulator